MSPIKPMLAVSGRPFSSAGWIFEPKIDGTRSLADVSKEGIRLYNRRRIDITPRYPEIAKAFVQAGLESGFMLDGEIAVFVDGRPSFSALASREHQSEKMRIDYLASALPASYVVFDILFAKGKSVMDLPLRQRKRLLLEALPESENVTISDSFAENGEDYFRAALQMGIEGVMAKRLDSLYQPGKRSPDWIKIKKSLKLDLVVGGFIPGKGARAHYFGSLLLGAYRQGRLHYVGRVGSGFTDEVLKEIAAGFSYLDHSPFSNAPPAPQARWVKPDRVVQVAALEVTEDGHLRAPVFLRTRDDKEPLECTLDQMN
jgi:DNA ligase D-like protein (predicted ligase)